MVRFFRFPYVSGIVPVKLFVERSLQIHLVKVQKKELGMCGQKQYEIVDNMETD